METALNYEGNQIDWIDVLYNIPSSSNSGTFPFTKVAEAGANTDGSPDYIPLTGVNFTLTPLGGGTPYSASSDASGEVIFTGVAPGIYVLAEDSGYGSYTPVPSIPVSLYWDADGNLSLRYLNSVGDWTYIDQNGNLVLVNRQNINLDFYKVDDSEAAAPVAGAEFALRDSGGSLVANSTSQVDGSFSFTELTQGSYTLTETVTPDGYQAIEPVTVVIGYENGASTLSVLQIGDALTPQMPYNIVDKKVIDIEFGIQTSDGSALAGARFTLTCVDDPSVQHTAVSDANGIVAFQGLTSGTYTLREIEAPSGYIATADTKIIIGYSSGSDALSVLEPENWASFVVINNLRPPGNTGGVTSYTVQFETNGGSAVDSQSIASGQTATEPEAPTREGYRFTGWYTDADCTEQYDFDTPVTANLTLYAGWESLASPAVQPYIEGYPDGTFRPDDSITRAEAAMMLYNLAHDKIITPRTATLESDGFTDVAPGSWYYDAVMYLAEMGTIDGYPNGSFDPEGQITRAEFTTMIVRFAGIPANVGEASFPDIMGHWAQDEIAAAQAAGLVSGYPNGNFGPDDDMTRAQAVTILNRMLGRSTDEGLFDGLEMPFSDVSAAHWAYWHIMAAAVEHEA